MIWPDQDVLRDTLEMMNFVGGIVLAITAILALRQLRIAEEILIATKQQLTLAANSLEQARIDMRIRSLREAVTLAAQLCEKLADSILPLEGSLRNALESLQLTADAWELRDAEFNLDSLVDDAAADAWHTKLEDEPCHEQMIHLLNDLEAFAIYFVRGAADESTAYASAGAVFCDTVEQLAPCLVRCRDEDAQCVSSGRFENTVALYTLWSERMRHGNLKAESVRLNAELAMLKDRAIQPIGAS